MPIDFKYFFGMLFRVIEYTFCEMLGKTFRAVYLIWYKKSLNLHKTPY